MAFRRYYYGCGKRKTAVAKVRIYDKGKGEFKVNGNTLEEYVQLPEYIDTVLSPLKITGHLKSFDVSILIRGGGKSSQADAMRHGISRSLLEFDADLRSVLKKEGFLTRDSRKKERKKFGLKRARRAPQFSKR